MTSERFTAWGVLLVGAVFATGCLQPSVYPLINPVDAIVDDRLNGTWKCGAETWRFVPTSEEIDGARFQHYLVNITAGVHAGTLRAWVGRLGANTFINFFPDGEDDSIGNNSAFFRSHVISVHTFGRLHIERDAVQLDMLDSEWVENASKDGRIALGVKVWSSDSVLLTASTDALQAFVRAHADDDQVFGERVQLVRNSGRQVGECL